MININNLSYSYTDYNVIKDFSSSFEQGKIHCLLGPSGCGKTTFLKLLAGLLPPSSGLIQGIDQASILFQEPRLIPQRNLYTNLELPIQKYYEKEERSKQVKEMLHLVDLEEWESSFPHQLSGGMQQRAAMARAFLYPSDLLLLDEPYRGLDLPLKKKLIDLLHRILEKKPRSLIAVTHQVEEALMLGGEIRLYHGNPFKEIKRWNPNLTPEQRKPFNQDFIRLEGEIRSKLLQNI